MSLERRAQMVFLLYFIISLTLITVISMRVLTAERTTNLQDMASRNVRQAAVYIDEKLRDMVYISQQMSYQGTIGAQLYSFLTLENAYDRMTAKDQIDEYIRLITFTNPKISLVSYYDLSTKNPILSSTAQREDFFEFSTPPLFAVNDLLFCGPHVSQSRYSTDNVLSLRRRVELFGTDDVYVYAEEEFDLGEYQSGSSDFSMTNYFIVVSSDGVINYSQLDRFEQGALFDTRGASTGAEAGFHWFSVKADAGWETVMFVPDREFFAARNAWLWQIALVAALALLLALILPSVVWNVLFRPMRSLDRDIRMIERGDVEKVVSTGIPEADKLLNQTLHMRGRILELIEQIEAKEKRRADMEIERLVHQINPHFLMNTINTVHWLAAVNNQPEIDQVATSLNKLLSYNLGKDGSTNLRKELNVLQEYIAIQLNRYSFEFELRVDIPQELLNTPVPRFILQPLAENAINHGIDEGGKLTVSVSLSESGEKIAVLIRDDGKGIPEGLNLSEGTGRGGMGIGIGYVRGMLESFYGDKAYIEIDKGEEQGTEVRVFLPCEAVGAQIGERESHDTCDDR